jgi:hypothetical protein
LTEASLEKETSAKTFTFESPTTKLGRSKFAIQRRHHTQGTDGTTVSTELATITKHDEMATQCAIEKIAIGKDDCVQVIRNRVFALIHRHIQNIEKIIRIGLVAIPSLRKGLKWKIEK